MSVVADPPQLIVVDGMACAVMVAGFTPILGSSVSIHGLIIIARLIGNTMVASILVHHDMPPTAAAAGICAVDDFLNREVGGRPRPLADNIEAVGEGGSGSYSPAGAAVDRDVLVPGGARVVDTAHVSPVPGLWQGGHHSWVFPRSRFGSG